MISLLELDRLTTCCGIGGFKLGVHSILGESWMILANLRSDGFWLGAILGCETTIGRGKDNS